MLFNSSVHIVFFLLQDVIKQTQALPTFGEYVVFKRTHNKLTSLRQLATLNVYSYHFYSSYHRVKNWRRRQVYLSHAKRL
jgi:hypothetical protein